MDQDQIKTTQSAQAPKHTGLAIVVAVGAAVFFYIIYNALFSFIISAYASYDASFASGFGALVLARFGSNICAFLSGAIVARKAFSKANSFGLFYGLATLIVVLAALSVLREIPDGSWMVAVINIAINATIIFVVRMVLLSDALAGP
jgi:hypothetical protein